MWARSAESACTGRPARALFPAVGTEDAEPLVLVVDDYADAREMYVEYLSMSGFRVAEAADGRAAVEKTKELHPDVILMDLSLPVIDGVEATRQIKTDPETKATHVIALTGHSEKEHTTAAREAGCESFVLKPCLPEDLVKEINKVLGRR